MLQLIPDITIKKISKECCGIGGAYGQEKVNYKLSKESCKLQIEVAMTIDKANKYWGLTIILLVVIIAIGGVIIWTKYSPGQPVEIFIPPSQELQGEVYVGGAVNSPGLYPLKAGDSIEAVIRAGGGTTDNADLNNLKLYVPELGEIYSPQKIDINRAEAWLLEAFSGIGKIRAQAIIDYRQQNGSFQNINGLTKVEGIGTAIFEQVAM